MGDEIKKPSIARLAVDTIKEAKSAGEELGRMITEMKTENERAIKRYQARVLSERREKRAHERELDQIALDEWIADEQRKENIVQVKQEVERTYGPGSWEKVQATKSRIQQIEQDDMREANRLRDQMNDLFWWCLGLAALLTYAFKLYK